MMQLWRQAAQPCQPLLPECLPRKLRHLPHGRPDGLQLGATSRELLKGFWHGKHLIRVADDSRPSQITNVIDNIHRARTCVSQIPTVKYQVWGGFTQVCYYGFEGGTIP